MPGKELVPRPAVQPPALQGQPPWVRDKPETVTAWKWLYRRRHWTLPVALIPGLLAAGLLLHMFHQARNVFIAAVIVLVVMAIAAPFKWDRTAERIYAVASVVAAGGWLLLAAHIGPLLAGWLDVPWLLVLLGAGVIAWGAAWWKHKRPRGMRRRQKLAAKWDAWWQSHAYHWNLGGSKVIDVWEMGLTTKVRVAGVAGRHSIQHVNQVLHLIESGLDGIADIGMVRAETVRGHPNRFDFYFKRANPLAAPVEYDPALAPRSVHEPFALGMSETGSWKMLPLRCNRFTIGMTRSGKSNDLLVGLAALTGCPDDRQILIDLKGGRSARPALEAGAADHVVTEIDEAVMTMRMLVAEILARAKYAHNPDGEEQLHAITETPALHLLIDETHGLTAATVPGGAGRAVILGDVASMGMGLEIYTWVYTQYGSLEESVSNEQVRGNLKVRTCYRVAEARHASWVIPEYAKMDASKLEEQGTCYINDGRSALGEQVRAPKMPHPRLKDIAAQNARMVARPPLVLYCGSEIAFGETTWQEWWDTRWLRLDPAFHAISPQYQALMAFSPAEAFATRPAAPAASPATEPGTGDGAAVAARIAAELDGVPDAAPPKVNLAPVLRTQRGHFTAALQTASPAGISPAQLVEESGMSRAWVNEQLKALVEAGAVTRAGRGRYLPVPGTDIGQAMETIKAQGDHLYQEARAAVSSAA